MLFQKLATATFKRYKEGQRGADVFCEQSEKLSSEIKCGREMSSKTRYGTAS